MDAVAVKARHILVKSKHLAEEAKRRVEAGEAFGKVAMEMSYCPSKTSEGSLGWLEKGATVKEFEDAAFHAPTNGEMLVVQTSFGWHVLAVDDAVEGSHRVRKTILPVFLPSFLALFAAWKAEYFLADTPFISQADFARKFFFFFSPAKPGLKLFEGFMSRRTSSQKDVQNSSTSCLARLHPMHGPKHWRLERSNPTREENSQVPVSTPPSDVCLGLNPGG